MPIIDYHCHLPACDIAIDRIFENITDIWLGGDHYKWRAMRTCGIHEKYITEMLLMKKISSLGNLAVPRLIRNPLPLTHLELKRIFGIDQLLNLTQQVTFTIGAMSYCVKEIFQYGPS